MKIRIRFGILSFIFTALFIWLCFSIYLRETVILTPEKGDLGQYEHPFELVSPQTREGGDSREAIVRWLLSRYDLDWDVKLSQSPWKLATDWINESQIHPDYVPELGGVLRAMATKKIISAGRGVHGTQVKLQLELEGGQVVSFKPKRYSRDYTVSGGPWDGYDRHNGEIAAYHLNRLLGLNRAPLMVGRVINLVEEIIPVASHSLLKTIYAQDGNACFYWECIQDPENATKGVCGQEEMLEGAVNLWIMSRKLDRHWHPWSRSYTGEVNMWEQSPDIYCNVLKQSTYSRLRFLLDLMDASILDFMTGNADRHHFDVLANVSDPMAILLDNGKTFGNASWDLETILAPLTQCCIVRESTWKRLLLVQDGVLTEVLRQILSKDPIHPVLAEPHYVAIDRRLRHIITAIDSCIERHGPEKVIKSRPGTRSKVNT